MATAKRVDDGYVRIDPSEVYQSVQEYHLRFVVDTLLDSRTAVKGVEAE